jgi:hypothetical protein
MDHAACPDPSVHTPAELLSGAAHNINDQLAIVLNALCLVEKHGPGAGLAEAKKAVLKLAGIAKDMQRWAIWAHLEPRYSNLSVSIQMLDPKWIPGAKGR